MKERRKKKSSKLIIILVVNKWVGLVMAHQTYEFHFFYLYVRVACIYPIFLGVGHIYLNVRVQNLGSTTKIDAQNRHARLLGPVLPLLFMIHIFYDNQNLGHNCNQICLNKLEPLFYPFFTL